MALAGTHWVILSLALIVGVAGEAGPGCEAGHKIATGAGRGVINLTRVQGYKPSFPAARFAHLESG
ncbi:MAG: hypothetical protein E5W25_03590 [Mesorhizobium sp.]|nr:MAG: hypothetical protein E5W25_03590 [Mesorhizobium sp.]